MEGIAINTLLTPHFNVKWYEIYTILLQEPILNFIRHTRLRIKLYMLSITGLSNSSAKCYMKKEV